MSVELRYLTTGDRRVFVVIAPSGRSDRDAAEDQAALRALLPAAPQRRPGRPDVDVGAAQRGRPARAAAALAAARLGDPAGHPPLPPGLSGLLAAGRVRAPLQRPGAARLAARLAPRRPQQQRQHQTGRRDPLASHRPRTHFISPRLEPGKVYQITMNFDKEETRFKLQRKSPLWPIRNSRTTKK